MAAEPTASANREMRTLAKFQSSGAAEYDSKITERVPGYALLHELSSVTMAALLPPDAHLLLVGAGTGSELVRLATIEPDWRFTAIDPSAEMLDRAKARAAAQGIVERVDWIEGAVPPHADRSRFRTL